MHMLYERPERLVLARLIMIDSGLQKVKACQFPPIENHKVDSYFYNFNSGQNG